MAKTQNDQLKSPAKDQENRILKNESLKPQIQPDQLGLNTQMANAVNFPEHATPDSILQLQQRYGNNEVRRIIQRERTENSITDNQNNLSKNIADEIQTAKSGGQPLQPDVSEQMQAKFGKDLSNVRLHTDQKADEISRKIQAKAFTIGNDIFFRNGAYSPNSAEGRDTLTHELTHVVQQSSGAVSNGSLKLGDPNDKYEKEAEGFAKSGQKQSQGVSGSTTGSVQRLSIAGIKTKIGGAFSKGGTQSTSTSPQGATQPSQTTAPPTITPKPGLKPEDLASVQQAGVVDQADWDSIPPEKQKLIFGLIKTDPALAQMLVTAFKASQWPKDGSDQDILDGNLFNIMTKTWNITLDQWLSITDKNRRKFLLENGTKPYAVDLASIAHQNKWPQDDTGADITDDAKLITMTKTLKIPINQWLSITDTNKRKCLLDNGTKPYAVELAGMALTVNWPKDGSDALIFDDGKLTTITGSLKISLTNWLSITKERRGFLLDNSSRTTYIGELVKLALQNSWLKGDSDQDILDDSKFKIITETLKISLAKWLSITEKDTRKFLLDKSGESYIGELVMLALQGNWPLDKNRDPIKDDGIFKKIKDKLKLSLSNWTKITSNERRGYLLEFGLYDDQLAELGTAAVSGIWPLDGGDRDISSAGDWKKIKKAYPQMSPSYWNGLGSQIRNQALSQTSTAEIQKAINNAKFKRDKKENAMDKIGEVTGHGATDTVLSSVGLAGSITSLSKGTGDNETLDRAGAATSAAADAGNFLASGGSLLGSISQLRRGSKMSDKNSSKASKQYGEKEKSRGRWGITQSVFGMAGSGSSFAGNVTKANDPTSDSADKASSGLGVAGGIFGMVGSALGIGKGSASINSARKRSSAAEKFIKKPPTGGSLSADETKMNAIAQLTAKSQNKTGKGFGIFKSATSFLGSTLGTIGGIGSLSGMSKDAGFGLGIAGAALSGLGILGGIGQMISEGKDKPSDSELDTQAANLISLLRSTDTNTKDQAFKFVIDVLKIKDVTTGDTSWIDEDEAAAIALIKSKLSKL